MWNTGDFHAGAQRLKDKFYSVKLMKNYLYELVDYIGLVDSAYVHMSKNLIVKKEDFPTLLEKKHCKKQCQDVDIRKKIFQEKMQLTNKEDNN